MPQPTLTAGPPIQAGSSESQRQLLKLNTLTYNSHSNPDDGQDNTDTNKLAHDPKTSHQLLKGKTLIRLQSALKWADMVDDAERDNALITNEGVRATPGKEKEPKKLIAKKKFPGTSAWKSVVFMENRSLRSSPCDRVSSANHYHLQWDIDLCNPRFLKGWVTINTFEDMVIQSWGERLTGDPIFVLMKKLQRLKIAIIIWKKDNMGGLQTQIETSVADLEDLQAQLDTNYSDRLMKEASSKQASLNGLLNLKDSIWRNDIVFEGTPFCSINLKCKIFAAVKEAADLSANNMSNNYFDLAIVVALGVSIKARPLPRVRSCT
ncbi:hypothetical protein GIB67_037293 [Kingdonia uniflora]|uniref:Uncharacterized protein n=1 Tax=Kingdonia uniflora TaxID=39325 RepID=A0A7J7MSH4_9MAGN|nr:hypothetical protein GIB67_037293 [Kingdonia uniflora]